MNLPKILTQNCPKYEIAQNFDAKSPKIYEITQNFARNFDTLHQPGGPVPPTSYAYDVNKNKEFTNMHNFFPDLCKQNVLFANKPNNTPDKESNQRFMFRRQK